MPPIEQQLFELLEEYGYYLTDREKRGVKNLLLPHLTKAK